MIGIFYQGLVDSDDEYFNDGLEEAPEKDDIIAACPFLSEEEKKVSFIWFTGHGCLILQQIVLSLLSRCKVQFLGMFFKLSLFANFSAKGYTICLLNQGLPVFFKRDM